jgi:hypothetical protein
MQEGMTLSQIDEMDIGLYFRLMKRRISSSAHVPTGYIDQVL